MIRRALILAAFFASIASEAAAPNIWTTRFFAACTPTIRGSGTSPPDNSQLNKGLSTLSTVLRTSSRT